MAEVIVAFDVPTSDEARRLADQLPELRWVKVGPMLFLHGGPPLVREFKQRGLCVFLDLKWHDIPHAVAGAVAAASRLGADLATVHALGGTAMLEAAGRQRGAMRLAAVSVLTSHSAATYQEALGRASVDLETEVARLVGVAMRAGIGAVVASPRELAGLREIVPRGTWLVVPGIRPAGSAVGDQRRVAEPADAVRAGATHLVVGRPVIQSKDPRSVYLRLCEVVCGTTP